MAELAIPALVGGTLLQAEGSFSAARAAGKQGVLARQEAERQAKQAETAASQTEAAHREELKRSLAAIDATFGATNLQGPTQNAIRSSYQTGYDRNRRIDVSNIRNQAAQIRRQGQIDYFAGRASRNAGYLNTFGNAFSSARYF